MIWLIWQGDQYELSAEQDEYDLEILDLLQKARRENDQFGVGTQPGVSQDDDLLASLKRLEKKGLVERMFENIDLIWWRAT